MDLLGVGLALIPAARGLRPGSVRPTRGSEARRGRGARVGPTMTPSVFKQQRSPVFFFFSNKLGWGKSIAISIVLTLLLLALFGLF